MNNPNFVVIGLRGASGQKIRELINKYRADGFRVQHKTAFNHGKSKLPHNGVLVCTKDA